MTGIKIKGEGRSEVSEGAVVIRRQGVKGIVTAWKVKEEKTPRGVRSSATDPGGRDPLKPRRAGAAGTIVIT